MKKIILMSALSALALTACDKNLYDSNAAPDEQKKTIADMVVPQDFSWEMTRSVTANIATAVAAPVQIYLDENCTEDLMIAEFEASPGYAEPLVLEVPTASQKLFVKYGNTVEAVEINNQTVALALETGAAEVAAEEAAAEAEANGVEGRPTETKIIKPWSTLMFEDLFPKKGDYDFNDLVGHYRTTAYYSKQGNSTKIHYIDIEFRVNAVGATLPITPYLKISNSKKNYFQKNKNDVSTLSGTSAGVSYEVVDDTHIGYLVLKFTGMTDKPSGVTYLNTIKTDPLHAPKVLKLRIEDHNEGTSLSDGDYFVYDFFITNGTNEIHKRGFDPVLGLGYPAGDIEGGAGTKKYSNGENLVWAIDIPALINHTSEKTNFLSAYPDFYDWATSGGTLKPNWYSTPVAASLINYLTSYPL